MKNDDPPSTSPRGLRIIELSAHRNVLDHAIFTELRAFDASEDWAREGATSCAAWMGWKLGMSPKTAQEHLRVARALGSLPILDDAMRRGILSYTQARALTRIATPESEYDLLELSRRTAGNQLEKICRFIRARVAADAGVIPEEALRLAFETFSDGSEELRTRLRPEQVVVLKSSVSAMKKLAADPKMSDADALVALAERATGDVRDEVVRPKVEALVIVDEAALREATRPPGARCELEDGTPISTETARRLTCDAVTRRVELRADGTPLDVGRRSRKVSKRLFKALLLRDGGCAFPGCTHRAFLDAHHIEHWSRGGATNEANLTLLCRTHHRYVHEGGFRVVPSSTGALFYTPSGELLARGCAQRDLSAGGVDPVQKALRLTASMGFTFRAEQRHFEHIPRLRAAYRAVVREALERLRRRGA